MKKRVARKQRVSLYVTRAHYSEAKGHCCIKYKRQAMLQQACGVLALLRARVFGRSTVGSPERTVQSVLGPLGWAEPALCGRRNESHLPPLVLYPGAATFHRSQYPFTALEWPPCHGTTVR
jgi:hypothetical protein